MSYNRDLESNRAAKLAHDDNQKKNAADRMKKVADSKKRRKAGKLI